MEKRCAALKRGLNHIILVSYRLSRQQHILKIQVSFFCNCCDFSWRVLVFEFVMVDKEFVYRVSLHVISIMGAPYCIIHVLSHVFLNPFIIDIFHVLQLGLTKVLGMLDFSVNIFRIPSMNLHWRFLQIVKTATAVYKHA